ncbi:hypothetical protein QUB70_26950 [Microcoleus sp. A003_D6]|uniref:hypothetical protein n=1 Tax=Microcoleus sp. A003_D6 TaxID=3055266 RepID=UPI002FD5643D
MNNPSSDQKLVNFLKQHRPNLPEAAPDFEQKLLAAIDRNEAGAKKLNYLGESQCTRSSKISRTIGFRKWAVSSAIAASLLVFWSGYRAFETAQLPDNETAKLEAFLVTNWEGVLHDSSEESMTERPQTDLLNFPVSPDSEPPTNH